MKLDPYMMSITRYEVRIREIEKEEVSSLAIMILGVVLVLFILIVLILASWNVHFVAWLALLVGLALICGGTIYYLRLRREKKELEQWKVWERKTQATLTKPSRRDFE